MMSHEKLHRWRHHLCRCILDIWRPDVHVPCCHHNSWLAQEMWVFILKTRDCPYRALTWPWERDHISWSEGHMCLKLSGYPNKGMKHCHAKIQPSISRRSVCSIEKRPTGLHSPPPHPPSHRVLNPACVKSYKGPANCFPYSCRPSLSIIYL